MHARCLFIVGCRFLAMADYAFASFLPMATPFIRLKIASAFFRWLSSFADFAMSYFRLALSPLIASRHAADTAAGYAARCLFASPYASISAIFSIFFRRRHHYFFDIYFQPLLRHAFAIFAFALHAAIFIILFSALTLFLLRHFLLALRFLRHCHAAMPLSCFLRRCRFAFAAAAITLLIFFACHSPFR